MTDPLAQDQAIETVEQLDERLSRPDDGVVQTLKQCEGDILVLGAAGKMGPTLSLMLKRALAEGGLKHKVTAVSRFSDQESRRFFQEHDIPVLECDLLDPKAVAVLPDVANVFFLAGRKFGTLDSEHLTWAMNALVPATVAARFKDSRVVALSTGCVYPMVPIEGKGCAESTRPDPPGEYAQSCLARERMFEYHSRLSKTPCALIRLNYAIDLRYGVLLDIAKKIMSGTPIDLSTGHVNLIWQGEANARIIRALAHCETPPKVLNITGEEKLSVRSLAERLGQILDRPPVFVGREAPTAWLSNSSLSARLFGPTKVSVEQMMIWVADWMKKGGKDLGKPTHFDTRSGTF